MKSTIEDNPFKKNLEKSIISVDTIAGVSFDGIGNTTELKTFLNDEKTPQYNEIGISLRYKGPEEKDKVESYNCREGLPGIKHPSLVKGTPVTIIVEETNAYGDTLIRNLYGFISKKPVPNTQKPIIKTPKH